jgi:hypothetical protein
MGGALPQVPTMSEAGLKGFASETYFGLLGPARIPQKLVTKVNADSVKQIESADLKTRFENGGAIASPSTPEGFPEDPGRGAGAREKDHPGYRHKTAVLTGELVIGGRSFWSSRADPDHCPPSTVHAFGTIK